MVRLILTGVMASVLVLLSETADAGFKKVGTAGFTFLKVGQSTRSAAMGDAYAAIADDINGIFQNPAGLTRIKRAEYMFTYTRWLVDSKFYSGAVAYKTGNMVWGMSLVTLQLPAFEETTIFQPGGTGQIFNNSNMALGGSFAVQLTNKMSFGAQIRFVQQELADRTNRTFSIDMGTMFYTGFRSARIAMSLQNFGKDNKVVLDRMFMPVVYSIGGAMEVLGEKGDPTYLTVSAQNVFFVDFEARVHMGAELWLANTLALRGGYKWNYDLEDFSLGVGLKREFGGRKFTLDLAYSNFGNHFDAPLRLTIGGSF